MRKLQQLRSMFLLLFIAILGGTWGTQRAHADTVSDFTGTWETDDVNPSAYDESTEYPILFFADFDAPGGFMEILDHPVTAGTLRTCTSSCNEGYSGTFVGGTMTVYVDNDAIPPAFTATITGGSYEGLNQIPCIYPDCYDYDEQTINFTGHWANGWTSVGTLSTDYDESLSGGNFGSGTLTMTTTTAPTTVPEPGGMTLLGTGMVLVVASLRLRLRNSSLVP